MKYILANWKMHFTNHQAVTMLKRLDNVIKYSENVSVVLFPPFSALSSLKNQIDLLKINQKFKLGVQNIYYEDEGAFTGEISAAMVSDMADFAIIGHSERRIFFGEDDELIAKKMQAAIRHNITPVLCIGENASEHTPMHAKRIVLSQLSSGLANLTAEEVGQVMVAYEPVWAIGSGNFSDPLEVGKMIQDIRAAAADMYSSSAAESLRVLYGGSVEPDNAKAYLKLKGCDGLLVGGASLNYQKFAKIIEKADAISL